MNCFLTIPLVQQCDEVVALESTGFKYILLSSNTMFQVISKDFWTLSLVGEAFNFSSSLHLISLYVGISSSFTALNYFIYISNQMQRYPLYFLCTIFILNQSNKTGVHMYYNLIKKQIIRINKLQRTSFFFGHYTFTNIF